MLCPIRWHSCIESEHSKRMKDRDVWTNQEVARLFYAWPLFYEAKHWKYHIFACATMCFTPRDCDSAASTYCMDLIKGSFVNATILNKVLSFRTIVSIYRTLHDVQPQLHCCVYSWKYQQKDDYLTALEWEDEYTCIFCSRKLLVND